ncbi:MAG: hypothetical protein ACJ788_23715, partial [Ktedonobacteraceae bacterium]
LLLEHEEYVSVLSAKVEDRSNEISVKNQCCCEIRREIINNICTVPSLAERTSLMREYFNFSKARISLKQ